MERRPRRPVRRALAATAALACGSALLSACAGGDSGKPTLNWYINPDGQETLTQLAEQCSTDEYDIAIQLLPTSATDQRTQLARRLAARDSSTDLMSLDPVFVPEFANAGWLAPFEGDLADQVVDDDVLAGAAETVMWEDQVVAAPQWANTQVLWFRRSLAEQAGLDMSQPVTWDQVIEAAASVDGATVGVQADRYEAYVVWINALVEGAGGSIVEDTEAGREAEVTIDSEAGREAAAVIQKLADSGATQPDFTTSNEGTSLGRMFPEDGGPGEFMNNWTFVYKNYEGTIGTPGGPADQEAFEDLGWARYPRTVEGEPSKPPIGGIDIGVGAYSENLDFAQEAAVCVTSPEAQSALAVNDGLMPSRASVYDSPELQEAYPADLLDLYRESIEEGGPRPKSAFYSQISSAVQSVWHPPTSVSPESTPEESAEFLRAVLDGEALL
ncbi:extracellular solute-binding protein [Nocardioides perillae]|uniref:Multiple sugar transport system substrate-binding protein n=1 Tax=Nocardioides perillae TaxID=1119534 RepID=A0A7Y9RU98_9ACTN|nr:extracellular solute-binding protein [Nocardioides perillae]NYG56737.1 multiple sugar transport system substrate-binding protein [Nocardioides perillae]